MRNAIDPQTRLSLLCAGSSAVLLCFSHVHPQLWFVSLFALVPFMWRLCHVGRGQAVAVGLTLASVYVCLTYLGLLVEAPGMFLARLLLFNAAFAVFALALNSARGRLRFNPLIIAGLWAPAGCLLVQYGGLNDLFGLSAGPELIGGLSSLGGLVVWSTVIILGNGLILLLARYVKRKLLRPRTIQRHGSRRLSIFAPADVFESAWLEIPHLRGPPLPTTTI